MIRDFFSRIKRRRPHAAGPQPDPSEWAYDVGLWGQPFSLLRQKWSEEPAGTARRRTPELLELSDEELHAEWERCRRAAADGDMFDVRGWYYTLYSDVLRSKLVVDVGSGLGFDAITFARAGADVICADIVRENLQIIERVAKIKGLASLEYLYLEDLESYDGLPVVDIIWCQGSMINMPFEIAKQEAAHLLRKLRPGGRWVELAYPEERWLREGSLPPTRWGDKTDGGAPWIEWYDLEKLKRRLAPQRVEVVLAFNFHNDDFNWFDLRKIA